MRTITLADGQVVTVECLSCAITEGLIEPTGGTIYEDEYLRSSTPIYPMPNLQV